jgi:hypothetical protein
LAFHRGPAWCDYCLEWLDDELIDADLLLLLDDDARPCAGECGRLIVDLRKRGQKVLTCSKACRQEYYSDQRRIERRARLPELPPLHCVECGTELTVTRSDLRHCSTRCRVRAHRHRSANLSS